MSRSDKAGSIILNVIVTTDHNGRQIPILKLSGNRADVKITLNKGEIDPAINALKYALAALEQLRREQAN